MTSDRVRSALPRPAAGRYPRVLVAFILSAAAALLLHAWPSAPPPAQAGVPGFVVNSSVDAVDANIGNNVCETSVAGQCTLRAAVQEANAFPGTNIIDFSNVTNGVPITLTIAGTDDTSAAGDLDLTDPTIIQGNGVGNTVIRACNDGAGSDVCTGVDRIFHHTTPDFLEVTGITLRRGNTAGGGSALFNGGGGNVTMSNVEIRNNFAAGAFLTGTGAINTTGGDVSILNTTLATNTGSNGSDDSNGGALYVGGGNVSVRGSTFFANSVGNGDLDRGGAIYAHAGTLAVVNSTFSNNSAADGASSIYGGGATVSLSFVTIAPSTGAALGGTMSIKNSIISGSTTGNECQGPGFTMLGVNVVDDISCGLAGPSIIVADPQLVALADNGGPTTTRALPTLSPAVDAATDCNSIGGLAAVTDQRGVDRPQDGNLPEGAVCDVGAYEREPNASLVVDSTLDQVDAAPGNGRCQSVTGACTLRAAVQEANTLPGADTITFSTDIDGQPVTLTLVGNDDAGAVGDLDVTQFLTITGNGHLNTIVRACNDGDGTTNCLGIDRIFQVANNAELQLRTMTLRRGNTPGGGGAIFASQGTLDLDEVHVRNNRAAGPSLSGAGAINTTGGGVTIRRSVIADNVAVAGVDDLNGAGLFMGGGSVFVVASAFLNNVVENSDLDLGGAIYAGAGSLLVTNTTFDGNSAPDGGGAIHRAGATVNLNHITVTASGGSGLSGAATVKNSIISGSSGANCGGAAKTMQGVNVVSDVTCGIAGPNIIVGNASLSALDDNGGVPPSRMPLPGSPAIDAAADCTLISGGPVSGDQRQLPRPIDGDGVGGAACDIGAHERSKGSLDTDGDGCSDEEESGPDPNFGGARNAFDAWDFFDAIGDQSIDLSDTLAVLSQFGLTPEDFGYEAALDREANDLARPWRTSPATGLQLGIDLGDALLNLQSFGHTCAGPP